MLRDKTNDNVKQSRVREKLTVMSLMICTTIFILVSYYIVNMIIRDMNIDIIKELSGREVEHLSNAISDEWNYMEVMCDTMECMDVDSDNDVIKSLQALSLNKGGSIVAVVDEKGMFYQSDGVINRQDNLYKLLKCYNGTFVFAYDYVHDTAIEKNREYLLIGKKIDLTAAGHKLEYVIRKARISEFDSALDMHIFGGRGTANVVDKNGVYVIWEDRMDNDIAHDNFFDKIKNDEIEGGLTKEKIIHDLNNHSNSTYRQTATIFAGYNGSDHIVNITKLDDVDWYYIAIVPLSVFSKMTYRLLAVIWIMFIFIAAVVMACTWREKSFRVFRQRETEKTNRILQNALSIAEQANKAKTVFLRSMSHDIRTPMNAISGFTELAIEHIDDKALVENYLSKISESTEHLLRLINDILDMSRIESGRLSMNIKVEKLTCVLGKIKSLFQLQMQERGQRLIWDCGGIRDNVVECDELRLSQILINIISNSVKYTQKNGEISFSVTQGDTNDNNVSIYEFRIKDNGMGMDEEFAAIIFEPFAREDTVAADAIQGTGLGMAITKSLVDLMNGTIECHSEKGIGTEMIIRLPFKVCNESEYIEEPASDKNNIDFSRFTGKRILLVDDKKLNQEIARIVLKESGFNVDIASNGEEACDMLFRQGAGYYDLVLMDIQMPGMNGYETTEKIRKYEDKEIANVTIYALTANAFEDEQEKILAAGMNGYMTKPINMKMLLKTLQNGLREESDK